jgi:hypothetical protein
MFAMTAKEWVEKFTQDMESGWLRTDDVIGVEYWTYDDVKYYAEEQDYYVDVTDVVAREVWAEAAAKLSYGGAVDNDSVRDTISEVFDNRIGGK